MSFYLPNPGLLPTGDEPAEFLDAPLVMADEIEVIPAPDEPDGETEIEPSEER